MAGILRLIESERQGNSVDRQLCHDLLRMLSSLGIYETSFQDHFLEDSRAFYEVEGLAKLQSSDVPSYLLHCEVRAPAAPRLVRASTRPLRVVVLRKSLAASSR